MSERREVTDHYIEITTLDYGDGGLQLVCPCGWHYEMRWEYDAAGQSTITPERAMEAATKHREEAG